MMQSISKKIMAALVIMVMVLPFFGTSTVLAQQKRTCDPTNQCQDCKDNNNDGKADYDGNDTVGSGKFVDPDPSCFTTNARNGIGPDGQKVQELNDDIARDASGKPLSIIPCTDKCTFSDVFRLLNNFITFFITKLLIPIFVIMIMYAGYKYIMAGANGSGKVDVKKMIWNILRGILLILCAWLIVHTIMTTLLNDDFQQSGVEVLGN